MNIFHPAADAVLGYAINAVVEHSRANGTELYHGSLMLSALGLGVLLTALVCYLDDKTQPDETRRAST